MFNNTITKLALITLIGGTSSLLAKCPLSVSLGSINPAPLTYQGEGEVKFYIADAVGGEVPHLDSFGEATCTLDIDMSKIQPKNQDITLITGTVNTYFDLTYTSDNKKLRLTQKADIPADTEFQVVIPLDIIEESDVTKPLNGFLANFLTNGSSVDEYTYTYPVVPTSPEIAVIDGTDVTQVDPVSVDTNDTTPEINGTCEANLTVTVQIDGQDIDPTAVCTEEGTFTITPTDPITEGEHNVTTTQVGKNNEVSPVSPVVELNIDTTAPEITITETNPLESGYVEVVGTTEPFAEVTVTFPTGETVNVTADENGDYTATSTTVQPSHGEVTSVATDEIGNTTQTPANDNYFVPLDPPTITTIDADTNPVVKSDNLTPEINGTCEAGYTVTIEIDGEAIEPTALCQEDGTYSVVPEDELPAGTHTVTATEIDALGNTISSEEITLTIERLADYEISIKVDPKTIIDEARDVEIVLTVSELLNGVNSGDLVISITKSDSLKLVYDSNMPTALGETLSNDSWEMGQTDTTYTFRYIANDTIFPSRTRQRIGIKGTFIPKAHTSGKFVLEAKIKNGSGDTNQLNNVDSDTMFSSNLSLIEK